MPSRLRGVGSPYCAALKHCHRTPEAGNASRRGRKISSTHPACTATKGALRPANGARTCSRRTAHSQHLRGVSSQPCTIPKPVNGARARRGVPYRLAASRPHWLRFAAHSKIGMVPRPLPQIQRESRAAQPGAEAPRRAVFRLSWPACGRRHFRLLRTGRCAAAGRQIRPVPA